MPGLVSVLIPVYNHARFLEQCLDSVADSEGPPRELLVVDDGSSDGSLEVARRWAGRRGGALARCEVTGQPNAGLVPTLNALLRRAKGDSILPLASDDYLLPGGLRCRLDALARNPGWLAVAGDCVVVDADGRRLHESSVRDLHHGDRKALASGRFRTREVLIRWSLAGPSTLYRRAAFESLGAYDEGSWLEDRDFYLRMIARGALGFIPDAVAAYRQHGANAGRNPAHYLKMERSLGSFAAARNAPRFSGLDRCWLECEAQLHRQRLRWLRGEKRRTPGYLLAKAASLALAALHRRALRTLG